MKAQLFPATASLRTAKAPCRILLSEEAESLTISVSRVCMYMHTHALAKKIIKESPPKRAPKLAPHNHLILSTLSPLKRLLSHLLMNRPVVYLKDYGM